jgi:hypothetical protein
MPKRKTRLILAATITGALAASVIVVANAGADEVATPGRVEAESFAEQSGAQVEGTSDTGGGKNVGWLGNGDWLRFDDVTVGTSVSARIASQNTNGGKIEIHAGTRNGTLLATIPVTSTGNWQKWATATAAATSAPAGPVFAVMRTSAHADFVNVNWFEFGSASPTSSAPAPAASSSAPGPTSSAPAPPPATGDGWVPIDQAKWDKQLAEFEATPARRVPAGNVRVPEFNASCKISHRLPDDPIVFPGMAGASHLHTFWGNKSTSAATTTESLFAGTATTCDPTGDDLSAYWIPTLLENGRPVDPHGVTVYYGSRLTDPTRTVPFPEGFRMIVGDAKRQVDTPKGAPAQFWCAGAGGEIGRSDDGNWPRCAPTAELTYQLTFPDCWDGRHLDSPDHKSHVGGTGPDGTCASGKFPVAIPSVSFVIGYPTSGGAAGFQLASGKASSMHGDFMFAWKTKPFAERVRDCITQKAKCNSAGGF